VRSDVTLPGRTWVDVTDLPKWGARPTGIPRVRAALASRYANDPSARFFAYRDASRQFLEVPRRQVLRQTARLARADVAPASPTQAQPRRGISGAVRALLQALPAPVRAWAQTAYDPVRRRKAQVVFEPSDRVIVLGNGWMQPTLQTELAERKRATGIRVYQILYDLSPVLYPHTFGGNFAANFTRSLHEAMTISDGIVSISQHTREDGLRFCDERDIPRPPMAVFRLGDEQGSVQPQPIEQLAGDAFVLSVGTFEFRKNYGVLYQAWRLARERGVVLPRLVIVGRKGWGAHEVRNAMAYDPQVKDSIVLLTSVSDGQLEWLYRTCRVTLYPSFYEGWGLPIAESLAHGKLCLAARSSAMPEVAGDLIDYFSPFSPEEVLEKLTTSLDPGRLAAKETEIAERYRPTTWDASYRQFVAAIDAFERVHRDEPGEPSGSRGA
jgi:glycosyltransferase involved in cell wall biosynthesis